MVAISRIARRIVRTVASLTGWALLLFAVAAMLVFAVGPHSGRYRTLTVLSGSMSGTFEPGDVIITRPVPITSLRVGDVITYTIPVDDHRVVTHRIVGMHGSAANPVVITKGDANQVRDPWEAQLQGTTAWRLQGHVPKAGYLLRSVHGKVVQRASIAALLLFAVLSLWRIWTSDDAVPARDREGDDDAVDADAVPAEGDFEGDETDGRDAGRHAA